MKKINILTIFPRPVENFTEVGILNQAFKKGKVTYNVVNIRDFSEDKHRKVDDKPYGGGPGMVIKAPPVVRALESIENPGTKILLSPGGEEFNQSTAEEFIDKNFTLICGRYAGIDQRVKKYIDRIISTGKYIVSGGELPALLFTEAVIRLIPGVLGDKKSLEEDKGYPLYTRPREFRGEKVPPVLLSGNHEKIKKFREREASYGKYNR
ncbi:MAG: tRNA (guanosine(37)-N1)-methyltransferase TrmD [Elusimicrobiota bacterium]